MSVTAPSDLVYDPHDRATILDPHDLFRRLREESPLYHNEELNFFAVSRFDDIVRTLLERETFISGRGVTLDILQSDMDIPPGTVIFEDPPAHGIHRALLARMFTPRRVSALEPDIRRLCGRLLDPLIGSGSFDFVADLGSQVPMRVIGMLMGIPESDQEVVRDHLLAGRSTYAPGDRTRYTGELFADYIDWRIDHPSDDIMTMLLYHEFDDETGTRRRLTRDELLAYVRIVSSAGNETTRILIGWMGRLLSEHPGQRRLLVEDPSLIPNAVEEILRFEPNTLQNCRYVAQRTEFHGCELPPGSIIATLTPSGNRDDRHFEQPDVFDVQRRMDHHVSFGFGPHYCLGQALARLEGRIVLDEVLRRFPTWDVDLASARFIYYPDARGYDSLPVSTC